MISALIWNVINCPTLIALLHYVTTNCALNIYIYNIYLQCVFEQGSHTE